MAKKSSRRNASLTNVFRRTSVVHDIRKNAERNKAQASAIEKLITLDAASRLPMPTASALANEIRQAQNEPKSNRSKEELLADADTYNNNNEAWTQVSNIAATIALLLSVPTSIAPLISGEIIKYVPDPKTLARVARLLALDTREFVHIHNAISAKYNGKEGSALTLEDQQLSREVFSEYINMFELWSSVILPVIDHMAMLIQTGLTEWAIVDKDAASERSAKINEVLNRIHGLVLQFQASNSLPEFVKNEEKEQALEALAEAEAE